MTPPATPWDRAALALRLLAIDPYGLGGLWLRARHGPVRAAFAGALGHLPHPVHKIHPGLSDEALFGGTDLAATLAAGKLVKATGIANKPGILQLTMAERATPGFAARLNRLLDAGTHAILVLDEGAEPDEVPPPALTERLAMFATLDGVPVSAIARIKIPDVVPGAVCLPGEALDRLIIAAASLGIDSLRAPRFATRAACALAALDGREEVTDEDLQTAAAMVYAHRAIRFPQEAEEQQEQTAEPRQAEDQPPARQGDAIPEDVLVEVVQAALPPDVLANLAHARTSRAAKGSGGRGQVRKGNRRGRPLPSRPGRISSDNRPDLVATMRTAVPWQGLRPKPDHVRLAIRTSDIRLKRYEDKSDRLLIFAVDASGSAAMARMAEAKGAVEILLAEAYARRDHVALVAFRGKMAELLLPPTRSLVQTRKRLAALPGGGGTPLAAGLQAALELVLSAEKRGLSPTLVLLTDGRANIALDGSANRAAAAADATRMAQAFATRALPVLVLDTGTRKSAVLAKLSIALAGRYLPLPRPGAKAMSEAVASALEN
ncbi:MAG: magnesium chelatase subunit D [Rhodobacteraceae bacterium]|nr:magnesium chelatase subunit D [Paracoccaceae bacterium]